MVPRINRPENPVVSLWIFSGIIAPGLNTYREFNAENFCKDDNKNIFFEIYFRNKSIIVISKKDSHLKFLSFLWEWLGWF